MVSEKRKDTEHRLVQCEKSVSPDPHRWMAPNSGAMDSYSERVALRDG